PPLLSTAPTIRKWSPYTFSILSRSLVRRSTIGLAAFPIPPMSM
ncbi:hypothetical protein EJMLMN_EJMLMN_07945, partial [Dysosmobacter welbionis]